MGIPKFFRWLSERYPLCSQLVTENRISEFDNLYLDMNGIIHHCSHPDDDAQVRFSDDKIFLNIFNYIDQLFQVISPKKVFFMAVDGVAPRAKMNQQRTRRFKSAQAAQEKKAQWVSKGQVQDEEPFDSNCITPGTDFMTRLSTHLKYFIHKKVTEDQRWREVRVIFSGHEVPGEGEHKIMDYIRTQRAQPGYNPNTRHCIYGLDADLIMLGLLSHEPHFALLREEITFSSKKRIEQEQKFFLLHLSVMREFLELEFAQVKAEIKDFEYDFEKIIDDFILFCFFVGNDFLPNLPSMYIPNGSLGVIFEVYKSLLPSLGGYINEQGHLNLGRCEKLIRELSENEKTVFDNERKAELLAKQRRQRRATEILSEEPVDQLVLTSNQKVIFQQLKEFHEDSKRRTDRSALEPLLFPGSISQRERQFVNKVCEELCLNVELGEENDRRQVIVWYDHSANLMNIVPQHHFDQVMNKYKSAKIYVDEYEQVAENEREEYNRSFVEWKKAYYREKLEIDPDSPDAIAAVRDSYITGLQWVLHYYYRGVASWSWFFPFHYGPMMSDLVNLEQVKLEYTIGKPFKPFEQLLAVLPPASIKHLPNAFHTLMSREDSPVKDFYPIDFKVDMNGKKNDWEAVVIVPFIDEQRLLKAAMAKEHLLTPEERARNGFGSDIVFTFDPKLNYTFASPSPAFPEVKNCPCRATAFQLPPIPPTGFTYGLLPAARLGKKALHGFPTLKTLAFTSELRVHGANLFGHESRNPSITFRMAPAREIPEEVAKNALGKKCFTDWPFLREAEVIAVTDALFAYTLDATKKVVSTPLTQEQLSSYPHIMKELETSFKKKGIFTGPISTLLHVTPLKGLKINSAGGLSKEYSTEVVVTIPVMTVFEVEEDPRFVPQPAIPLEKKYPVGRPLIFLGKKGYGSLGVIGKHSPEGASSKLNLKLTDFLGDDDQAFLAALSEKEETDTYTPLHQVSKMLGISMRVLNRLTASFYVRDHTGEKVNVGLNFKFSKQNQKVLGYSRRRASDSDQGEGVWELSSKAIDIVDEFVRTFPDFFQALEELPLDLTVPTCLEVASSIPMFQKIMEWRRAKELDKLPTVDCDFEMFSAAQIKKIEDLVTSHLQSKPSENQKLVKDVPPDYVLLPSRFNDSTLEAQTFSLGDRVVYALDFGTLPFGCRGTVVGATKKFPRVEVLFDEPVFSGTDLDGRCSKQRGAIVRISSLVNVTNRQLPLKKATGAAAPAKPASALASLLSSSSTFPSSLLPLQSLLSRSNPPSPGPSQGRGGRFGGNRTQPLRPVAQHASNAPSPAESPKPATPVKATSVSKEISYSSMLSKAAPSPKASVPSFPAPPQPEHLPPSALVDYRLASQHLLNILHIPQPTSQPSTQVASGMSAPVPVPVHVPAAVPLASTPAKSTPEGSRQASIALLSMLRVGETLPPVEQATPRPAAAPAASLAVPMAVTPTSEVQNGRARNELLQMLGAPVQPAPSQTPLLSQPRPQPNLTLQTVLPPPPPPSSSSVSRGNKSALAPAQASKERPMLLLPNMKWKGADTPKTK